MKTSLRFTLTASAALLLGSLSVRADILYVSEYFTRTTKQFTSDGVGSIFADASDGLRRPRELAFDGAGNLYVADHAADAIIKITPGGDVSVFASGVAARGLAFDSAGNLYTTTGSFQFAIERFAPDGTRSLFAGDLLGLPRTLAFDRAGDLYVSTATGSISGFDSAGNSYVSHFTGTIEKFTPDGVGSFFASPSVRLPDGLAFDSAGNLFVAGFNDHMIEKFTPDGVGSIFADASDGLRQPHGLAFDSAGNLYVANDSSTIEKFTPDGVGSVFAIAHNSHLAFTDDNGVPLLQPGGRLIPEPATWALVGLGLPVLLGLSRPRRMGKAVEN